MPPLVQLARPLKLRSLTHLLRIGGVDVFVHWSVLVIAALMIAGGTRKPLLAITVLACWMGVLLLHECGHMIMARRKRCRVLSIRLYPVFGLCEFETPWSRVDRALIAWGGVLAQAVIGIPLVVWILIIGYTPFEPLNAVLALFGFFSLAEAALNLIPKAPLDGAIAWDLIPALISRNREQRNKRPPVWRR